MLFHCGLSQDSDSNSLWYTVGACCLSILYILVCVYNPKLPALPSEYDILWLFALIFSINPPAPIPAVSAQGALPTVLGLVPVASSTGSSQTLQERGLRMQRPHGPRRLVPRLWRAGRPQAGHREAQKKAPWPPGAWSCGSGGRAGCRPGHREAQRSPLPLHLFVWAPSPFPLEELPLPLGSHSRL